MFRRKRCTQYYEKQNGKHGKLTPQHLWWLIQYDVPTGKIDRKSVERIEFYNRKGTWTEQKAWQLSSISGLRYLEVLRPLPEHEPQMELLVLTPVADICRMWIREPAALFSHSLSLHTALPMETHSNGHVVQAQASVRNQIHRKVIVTEFSTIAIVGKLQNCSWVTRVRDGSGLCNCLCDVPAFPFISTV